MNSIYIEEITDINKFHGLREPWDGLLEKSVDNNIFLTWEWLYYWWKNHGDTKKLKILLIKDKENIIGIAPLMQTKYRFGIFSFDLIENICGAKTDYGGIILTQKHTEAVEALLHWLIKTIQKKRNTFLRIWHIPEDNALLSLFREQYPSFSESISYRERRVSTCPYINLPDTWEEYLHTLKNNSRNNLRRKVKSLHQHVVELKTSHGESCLNSQLESLFSLHQKRWKQNINPSKFNNSKERDFYRDVSNAFQRKGWLNLSVLDLDGISVSVAWCFNYNNKLSYMTCAFDPDYSEKSVGTVHLIKLIESAIQSRLKKFDFLKGREEYKFRWARNATNNIQITLIKKSKIVDLLFQVFRVLVKTNSINIKLYLVLKKYLDIRIYRT